MSRPPITAARIDWGDDGVPRAPGFDDIYRPRDDPYAQAQQVFLHGNGLPERWRGRDHFTVLETGFGLAHNFVATWQAWRNDPQRPRRLSYVAVELHPPTRDDLVRAHGPAAAALAAQWPPLAPGVHVLPLEGGQVRLLLVFGDVQQCLPALRLRADALFLDGFAPDRNAAMWDRRVFDTLARQCAPGATAATWSVARVVRDGLTRAGFETRRVPGQGAKREVLQATFAPRFDVVAAPRKPHDAVIIGAGLAGASAAAALAAEGVRVTVLERAGQPAAEASGNPAGIFHGVVHPDDGPHARLLRAGARHLARCLAPGVPGTTAGLLRLERDADAWPRMQALLQGLGLGADEVQALDAAAASERAGVPIQRPAWWYPQAGWVSPADWVNHALATPGVTLRCGCQVAHWLRRDDGRIDVRASDGSTLASADVLVIAAPDATLAPALADARLESVRGQVSWTQAPLSDAPRLPIAGDGYMLTLPDGRCLFGATSDIGDTRDSETTARDADHQRNLKRLQQMLPALGHAVARQPLAGRVGWRVKSADRLPLAGPMPAWPAATPHERLARWPREPGIFLLTALGSRGLTLAPLLGELVAAQICGTPWPLTQDLADAVDPARFAVRAYRKR